MRWGLVSTARINDAVIDGAAGSDAVEIVAVASRDDARARAYAREKRIPRAYGSYEQLLSDPEIDAVYIGLPNGLHVEWAIKALEAGKHVLVEKPFSPRVSEVERAFDVAADHGRVLSEGFMWRHTPQTQRLVELLREIGEVRLVRATFSFPLDRPGDVRWEPGLEGGALMDVGCYCISGIRLVCGEPSDIAGFGIGDEVDSRFAGALRFESGALATFDCGFDLPHRGGLEVIGSTGTLVLSDPWHARSPGIELIRKGKSKYVRPDAANAYKLELEDVSAAARDGRAPLLGRDDAVGQARVIEALLS